jgi:hypothetical protein
MNMGFNLEAVDFVKVSEDSKVMLYDEAIQEEIDRMRARFELLEDIQRHRKEIKYLKEKIGYFNDIFKKQNDFLNEIKVAWDGYSSANITGEDELADRCLDRLRTVLEKLDKDT